MQEIIDIYGENKIVSIVQDFKQLEEIYKKASLARSGKENVEYLNLQLAIDYYMKKVVLSSQKQLFPLFDNYKKVFSFACNQDESYLFSNPLMKCSKERLAPVMNSQVYDSLQNQRNKIQNHCYEIYEKMQNNDPSSLKDRQYFLSFLRSNIGTSDSSVFEMQEFTIRKFLQEKGSYGYEATDFVVSFIAQEEAKKNGTVACCHLSEYRASSNEKFVDKCHGVARGKIVTINEKYGIDCLNDKEQKLGEFLHVICHEMQHVKQKEDILHGVRNTKILDCLDDVLFRSYFSTDEFNYYKKNYYFESGEIDAEISGYMNSIFYLKKYGILSSENKEQLLDLKDKQNYKQMVDMRKNEQDVKMEANHFKNEKRNELVKEHPELILQYSQLQTFYHLDGQKKTFQEMLLDRAHFQKKDSQDSSDIYYSSFLEELDHNGLEDLDFSNLKKEDLFALIHSLFDLYGFCSNSSHKLLTATRKGASSVQEVSSYSSVLNQNIIQIKKRCMSLEKVLDAMSFSFGDDYKKIYSQDQFLYNRDKEYSKNKFLKIDQLQEQQKYLTEMIEGRPSSQSISSDQIRKK